MECIIKNYPKDIEINIQYKKLTNDIKEELKTEFEQLYFIHSELEQLLKSKRYCIYNYDNITLQFLVINNINNDVMYNLMKRIYTIVKIYNISYPINIWFIPTNTKRQFPKNGEMVDRVNINGGYTYLNKHTIYVYRYEDFEKVILHEILHNSELQVPWSSKCLKELCNLFTISYYSEFDPTEAFIEMWALYYHIMFIAYETGSNFECLINKDIEWNMYLANKLLKYKDKYFKNGWIERTNSFSYIILKTIFLCNWKNFLRLKEPYTDKQLNRFIKRNYKGVFEKIETCKNFKTNSFCISFYGNK
jgi:hypothetical protein